MDDLDISYRNQRDRTIRARQCQFILQLHLLRPLMEAMCRYPGNLILTSAEDIDRLNSFLTSELRDQLTGEGPKCLAFEPRMLHFIITIRVEGESCLVRGPWRDMFKRCNMKEKAAMSMWAYYEEGQPHFVLRLDGYASKGKPLPPLTNMSIVDEPLPEESSSSDGDDKQKKKAKQGCRCSVI